MAYDVPTLSDFRTRFPEFDEETDERVQLFLDDASARIDDTWREIDYPLAILYFAAFLLESSRATARTTGASLPGPVRSQSLRGMSQTYAVNDKAGFAGYSFAANAYGVRFAQLLRLNHIPFEIV